MRAKDLSRLDIGHLVEEIDRVGTSVQRAISRPVQCLLLNLLKWRHQPTHRAPSWRTSVMQARDAIADALEENPSLRDDLRQRLALAYRRARRDALAQTGLPAAMVPEVCPWPVEALLAEDFWPEA